MAVTVRVYGVLRSILGESRLEVSLAGSSVGDLIDELAAKYGDKVRQELLDEDGSLDCAYLFFVGGESVHSLSQGLENGDEVVITTMIAGGRMDRRG